MYRTLSLILLFALPLSGCGTQLDGLYVAMPVVHELKDESADGYMNQALETEEAWAKAEQDLALKFDGSMVIIINASGASEYPYRIEGKQVEVTLKEDGQERVIRMGLINDESVVYMGNVYRKKKASKPDDS